MRKIVGTLLALTTVVALAACGGSSNKAATSNNSSSPSSSSSASSSAAAGGGDGGDFCKQIVAIKPENVGDDPNGAKQALAVLKQVSPPDEIKGDWDDYLAALQELSDAGTNDRAALATIAGKHAKSLSSVSLYISKSCLANFGSSDLSSLSDSLSSLSDSLSSSGN